MEKAQTTSTDPREHLGIATIPALLKEFSIPAVVGLLVNGTYNIIDRIFVGHAVGVLGIAGMTIGFPIIIASMALTLLFSVGANVIFGIRIGEKLYDEAEEILGNVFILMICVALIVSIVFSIFMRPILLALSVSEAVYPFAVDYLSIILIGNVFATLSLGLTALMRSSGAPRKSLATQVLGTVINATLAPILIFKFDMGIRGGAIATVVAQFASTIWCINYFINKKTPYRIKLKYFKVKWKNFINIIKLGASPFAMNLCNAIVNIVLIGMLQTYGGDVGVSVIGLIISINSVIVFPIMGISQGMQPIVSYNYGARNLQRILTTYKYSVIIATIYVIIGFTILQIFPDYIIMMFNSEETELIALGAHSLRLFSICFPLVGFQIITSIFFQATNRPTISIILSLSRQLIFLLPLVSILPRIIGFDGAIISFPIADFLSVTLAFILIKREMKIYKRQLRDNDKFIY